MDAHILEAISMVIQHNMSAMYAANLLNRTVFEQTRAAEMLTSGYKIPNKEIEDAAGLTISERMKWQVRGLSRASANAEEGISLIQVASGALGEIHDNLKRMREIYEENCGDNVNYTDRESLYQETMNLYHHIIEIAENTSFQGHYILSGENSGANEGVSYMAQRTGFAGNGVKITIPNCSPETVGDLGEEYQLFYGTVHFPDGSELHHFGLQELLTNTSQDVSHVAFLNPEGTEISEYYTMMAIPNSDITFQVYDASIDGVAELRRNLAQIRKQLEASMESYRPLEREETEEAAELSEAMVFSSKANIAENAREAMMSQSRIQAASVMQLLK